MSTCKTHLVFQYIESFFQYNLTERLDGKNIIFHKKFRLLDLLANKISFFYVYIDIYIYAIMLTA